MESTISKYWEVGTDVVSCEPILRFFATLLSECYQVGRAEYFRLGKADYLSNKSDIYGRRNPRNWDFVQNDWGFKQTF